MDLFLKNLCTVHRLTSASMTYSPDNGRFCAFLHWEAGGLAFAYGDTADDAVRLALADMSRNRADTARHSGEAA